MINRKYGEQNLEHGANYIMQLVNQRKLKLEVRKLVNFWSNEPERLAKQISEFVSYSPDTMIYLLTNWQKYGIEEKDIINIWHLGKMLMNNYEKKYSLDYIYVTEELRKNKEKIPDTLNKHLEWILENYGW